MVWDSSGLGFELDTPKNPNPFDEGIPGIQTTISWY